jgi:hypothetical protein
MLENYHVDENGVIIQDNREPFLYDVQYIKDLYNGADISRTAYLRLGYIIGSIGKIPSSVLDVGYGGADFLKAAVNLIPNCFGHEINQWPIPTGCTFVEDIYANHYDVITFFDVLEHFENAYDVLRKIQCEYVCVSLPWCNYISDEWFKNWKHLRPNQHLHHFNSTSLTKTFDVCGFDRVNTCNVEDACRIDKRYAPNILSGIFKKR